MIGLVSIPTRHRTQESQLVCGITVTHCKTPLTEDKLTNTFASGNNTTGKSPTARTWLAAHWWVPVGTPTGPQQASRDTWRQKDVHESTADLGGTKTKSSV